MALKSRVKDLETIPEDDRKYYQEEPDDSGFHVLAVEPVDGFALEDVRGLRDALSSERGVTTKLAKLLEPLVEDGIAVQDEKGNFTETDISKIKEWKTEIDRLKAEADKPADPDENLKLAMEAREQRFLEKQKKDLAERDSRIEQLQRELDIEVLESKAVSSINKHKGNVTLLLPHVMGQMVGEKDASGRRVARIRNSEGDGYRLTEKSGSTEPMDVDEFVDGLRSQTTFAGAFAGSGASGGGASGSQGGAGGPTGGKFQISVADAQDPVRYRQIRKQAMDAGEALQIVE